MNFLVAAVDDLELDGPRTATITPWVTASGSGIRLAAGLPATVTVNDDESPALRVALAKKLVPEGLATATLATVTRNTGPGPALVVSLVSSDPSEATVPPSLTILEGADAASCAVSSVNDALPDGNQTVTITASASDYLSGAETLVVSDTDLPDLVVGNLTVPATAEAEAYFEVGYQVINQGLGPASATWTTRVWLSRDPVVGDDALLDEASTEGTLPVGRFLGETFRARAPRAVGPYWVIVTTDVADTVGETLEDNNTTVSSAPLEVRAPYAVSVETDVETALAGTPVPLRGRALRADQGPAPFVPVNLHLTLRGTTRVLSAITDADGRYTATFQPFANEAGRYGVGAAHPGVAETAVQDTFDLLGFEAAPAWVSVSVTELATVSGTVKLANLGELPLSGLTAAVMDAPASLEVGLTVDNEGKLPGSAHLDLKYTLKATNASIPSGMVTVRVSSAEGPSLTLPLYVAVAPLRARLVATPDRLAGGMVRGRPRTVQFELSNQGAVTSGPITVALPALPWLQLASTNPLPSLTAGETNLVSLLLTPSGELALGSHSGALALSCASVVPWTP